MFTSCKGNSPGLVTRVVGDSFPGNFPGSLDEGGQLISTWQVAEGEEFGGAGQEGVYGPDPEVVSITLHGLLPRAQSCDHI